LGSKKVRRLLDNNDLVGSMGRVGAACDNAAMESFLSLLQKNVFHCPAAGSGWRGRDLAHRECADPWRVRRSLSWLNSAGMWREPYHRPRMAALDRYPTLSAHQPGLRWLCPAGGWSGTPQTMNWPPLERAVPDEEALTGLGLLA